MENCHSTIQKIWLSQTTLNETNQTHNNVYCYVQNMIVRIAGQTIGKVFISLVYLDGMNQTNVHYYHHRRRRHNHRN